MLAKYNGRCPNCHDSIQEGDEIFKRSRLWICARCNAGVQTNGTVPDLEKLQNGVAKLNRPALRVFLNLMGTPYTKHPKHVEQQRETAKTLVAENVDKATKAYLAVTTGTHNDVVQSTTTETLNVNELAKEVSAVLGFKASDIVSDVYKAITIIVQETASKELGKYRRIEVKNPTGPIKRLKDVMPEEFDTILKLAQVRQNILLVGPSGCGKTFIAGKLAEALGFSFSMQSCSAGISESQLTGWLLPVGASGKFDYVPSEFVKAYEKGGVFLLDEMDAADPQILMIVNAALANGNMVVPQRFKNPIVKRHKNFVCVAAANTFGHGESTLYAGREMLDGATLDRFRAGVVYMNYSPRVEEELVDTEILAWGREVREAIDSHGLERIMSTRVLMDFTKLKREQKWSTKQMQSSYFVDWSEDERRLAA